MRMIIANFPYGRLGNQLELAAHLIVFAETEKKTIALEFLEKAAQNFPFFEGDSLNLYPPSALSPALKKIIKRVLYKLINYKVIKQIDFLKKNEWIYYDDESSSNNKDLSALKSAWLCTCKLWRFRSKYEIAKYYKVIKKVFTPNQNILDRGQQFIKQLNSDVIIGVHIRWGDYKTEAPWLYHDIEVYKSRMIEARNLFPGQKVGFIVCSEEGKELKELTELNCVYPQSDAITDLYTLAQCQYLIATSSTFSNWASYWGNIGLFTISDRFKKIVKKTDFVISDLIVQN